MDLPQEDWTKQLKKDTNAVILDVRTADEVEQGSIPNAKNIDIFKGQEFLDAVEALDKTKHYYIYCKSGGRSAQACTIMHQLGFENTYNLIGGFTNWVGDVKY